MKKSNKYTKEYCQEILNSKNNRLNVVDIVGDNLTTMKCIMSCGNKEHDLIINNCCTLERNKPYCKQCKFENDVLNKYPSREFIVIGKFVQTHKKINIFHTKCNKIWSVEPNNFLHNDGCAVCNKINARQKLSKSLIKSQEDFENRLSTIHDIKEYKFLDKYVKSCEKITIQHLKCGHIYSVSPQNFISAGNRCPKCNPHIVTHDIFINRLAKTYLEEYEFISEYVAHNFPIHIRHKKCGTEFYTKPTNLYQGYGNCECCYKNKSSGEIRAYNFLKENEINFKFEKSLDELVGINRKPLRIDFYIYKTDIIPKDIIIEINGKQHYEPVEHFGGIDFYKKQIEHDKRKREYAKTKEIDMLEIPYWDFDNIENILKEKLNIA